MRLLFGSIIVASFILAMYTVSQGSRRDITIPLPSSVGGYDAIRGEWSRRIDEVGAQKAWDELKEQYMAKGPAAHTYSHVFGGLLYRKFGNEGIVICDDAMSFGCFHEFIGEAIAGQGTGAVAKLSTFCERADQQASSACRHGIGHGIMAYLGYASSNIPEALEICNSVEHLEIGGCNGGVFMEYNFQTMLEDKAAVRQFQPEHPYDPCPSFEAKYRTACYFWQPNWWGLVMSGDMPQKYDRMGSYCSALSVLVERENCYRGIGNMTGDFSEWKADRAVSLCTRLGGEGEVWCRENAATIFRVTTAETQRVASQLCEGLAGEQFVHCMERTQ